MNSEYNTCFCAGEELDREQLDENTSWEDSLGTIMSELHEAGVAQEYLAGFSAFLYSSYINRLPLMLAGPYGQDIADALSASLYGCKAACLNCVYDFTPDIFAEIENSSAEIITVKSIFSADWLTPLLDFIQHSSKYFIILHPFIEDLLIEPKSLYNYIHPLYTSLFMDNIPSGLLVGGKSINGYKPYISSENNVRHPILNSLYSGKLFIKRMNKVLNDAEKLSGIESADLAFSCCYFPYACSVGKVDYISGEIQRSDDLSKNLSREMTDLIN